MVINLNKKGCVDEKTTSESFLSIVLDFSVVIYFIIYDHQSSLYWKWNKFCDRNTGGECSQEFFLRSMKILYASS